MRAKPFVIGTVAGGITVFVTGFVMFTWPPLQSFYNYAMTAGAATGVPRESPLFWAVLLGALSYGALVTLAIGSRVRSIVAGMKTGAAVGFLLWFTSSFMLYGISHVGNLTSTLVDPLVELVPGALAGALIVMVMRKSDTATRSGAPAH